MFPSDNPLYASLGNSRLLRLLIAYVLLIVSIGGTPSMAQTTSPVYDPDGATRRVDSIFEQQRNVEANSGTLEDVRGRQEWFRFQRAYPFDRIPAGARMNALRQMRETEARMSLARSRYKQIGSLQAANRWEEIGPANQSGRVRAIASDPRSPGTIYIGAAAGGVWKTLDNGANWRTTTDTLGAIAMGALAVDPSNPDIVYMGTGENSANIDAYLGNGLYRSTDAGTSWQNIGLQNVAAFSKIVVHPTNPDIIWAATGKSAGGLYRTTDGGGEWTRVVSGDVWDLVVDPVNPNNVYIAMTSSVRKSTDAGASFSSAQSGLSLSGSLRISIGIAASQPERLYILVAKNTGSTSNHAGEVYRSNNSAGSWTLVNTLPSSFFNRQGWYDNCIAVHPADPDIVLVGGIDVYQSINGGTTFSNTTRAYSGGNVHADQHILEFDRSQPGLVYLGNDGGVYASVNAGSEWIKVSDRMATSQYYGIEVDQSRPFRVYGGTQDNGTHGHYGGASYEPVWNKILGGDGFNVVVDLSNPDIIYAENFYGTPLYRINANNTNSRTRIDASISPSSESGDVGFWSTPIAMSPADKITLYTGRTGLWRTTNRGGSWQKLVPGNATDSRGKITAIGLSPHDAGRMMIGTAADNARYSTDDGATWARSAGLPNRFVTDIRYDPVNTTRVYVTVSGFGAAHVFRSEDNGATFTSVSSNLPDVPAGSIEIDPTNTQILFAGTDIGVFATLDGGNFWFPFNDGIALVPVVSLKLHRSSRTLVAGTHGRSMFRVSIDNIQPAPALIAPVGGETFPTPGDITVRWGGFPGAVRVFISYNGGGNFNLVADNVTGTSTTITLPIVRTSNARVRVESLDASARVESGDFNLTATPNAQMLPRPYSVGAIEVRGDELWGMLKESDSLVRVTTPLLAAFKTLPRTGIPGKVKDMAWDSARGVFYVLVTADDFSAPRLFAMDTTGTAVGEITPLPLTSILGVAILPDGIGLIEPGTTCRMVVIDSAGTVVRQTEPLNNASGALRRGLVWDGLGLVQGATFSDPGIVFPSELQHLTYTDPFRIRERSTIIPSNGNRIDFFGLAADISSNDIDEQIFWATDTAGVFYKFVRGAFFTTSVGSGGSRYFRSSDVAISSISPNPARDRVEIRFSVAGRREVHIDLYDATGRRLVAVYSGVAEGEQTRFAETTEVPSGVYYIAVDAGDGARDVRPVVVVR